jgi:hypothetical protein
MAASREKEEDVFFILVPDQVSIIIYKSISELELYQTVWSEIGSM